MFCSKISPVAFPKSQNININMMPFIIGDIKSIPLEYRHYWDMLQKCFLDDSQYGKVGYLSITESNVTKGNTHRRSGIHTEKHNNLGWGAGWGSGSSSNNKLYGGLFLASNIGNSTRAWNMEVNDPKNMGCCEHLKDTLKNEIIFNKNHLYWITDSCPHESIPLKNNIHRQWFRYVTSDVGMWYAKYSTPNRLGIVQNCPINNELYDEKKYQK
jgi:hypothetical protein